MKFSILLPTRDRLDLLKLAVASVQTQDDPDWEIVVSDNASADDIGAYVRSLADPRVRCIRQPTLIPVTENWTAALDASTGEYSIMLGDDDALMPGCLSALRRAIADGGEPDAVYMQAWQYAYPGVVPGHAEGFVQVGFCEFLPKSDEAPFVLPTTTARRMAVEAMAFRIRYGFNMQHFAISRRFVDSLRSRGPFYQSPYPDYYAANVIMLTAPRIVVVPRPLTIIGMSPKSFGYYYFNRREGEGVQFLQNIASAAVRKKLRTEFVPGTNMNDSWLCSMQTLATNFPEAGLVPDYRRYRLLQYHALAKEGPGALLKSVRFADLVALSPMFLQYALASVMPGGDRAARLDRIRATFSAYPRFDPGRRTVPYRDILEAARGLAA